MWNEEDFNQAKAEVEAAHPHIKLDLDEDSIGINVELPSYADDPEQEPDHFGDRDEAVDEIQNHAWDLLANHGIYLAWPAYTEGDSEGKHYVCYNVENGPSSPPNSGSPTRIFSVSSSR